MFVTTANATSTSAASAATAPAATAPCPSSSSSEVPEEQQCGCGGCLQQHFQPALDSACRFQSIGCSKHNRTQAQAADGNINNHDQ